MTEKEKHDYALLDMGDAIDKIVERFMYKADLTHKQVADELRALAQGWEDAA